MLTEHSVGMKLFFKLFFVSLLLGGAYGTYRYLDSDLHKLTVPTGTGISAKQLCSLHFISGFSEERARELYIDPALDWASDYIRTSLSEDRRSASASFMGLYKQTAKYREGLGCTLDHGKPLEGEPVSIEQADARPISVDAAHATTVFDVAALNQAIEKSFEEPQGFGRNTLAVAVLHDGKLVAEKYADGVTLDTPLLGWSMTKSVTATLAGQMTLAGEIDVQAAGAVTTDPDNTRSALTLDHLLRMTSGLAIDERNDGTDPNSKMLFIEQDMAAFAGTRNERHAPEAVWDYMSGSTNLAMRRLQDVLGGAPEDQVESIRRRLFRPLGINTAIIEMDGRGTLVGSSYMWASARDWAKIGQLYLDAGKVENQQIISSDWVDYISEPTPGSGGNYGSGFWLSDDESPTRLRMDGFQGQFTFISRQHNIVVVRLGATTNQSTGAGELYRSIVAALR